VADSCERGDKPPAFSAMESVNRSVYHYNNKPLLYQISGSRT
jgi:hypothetical protein